MDTVRVLLSRIRTLLLISKNDKGDPPSPPSFAPKNVAEHESLYLEIHKHPLRCLNKLLWLSQDSKCNWSSYMFSRLSKMSWVLNKPGFKIWPGCIRKVYTEFWICIFMAPYASIMPEYSWICLNVHQYAWILLNIAECFWTCLKMPE